jgi:hypothetical protein
VDADAAAALEVGEKEAVAQLVDGIGAWRLLVTCHKSHVTRHKSHVTCKHACKKQPIRLENAMHLQ